ncbi:hypothetical protein SNEBB_003397 [Seison nebaliae]|nr:hypothetical protein SNEBB_003397 [Seison nebaliae]
MLKTYYNGEHDGEGIEDDEDDDLEDTLFLLSVEDFKNFIHDPKSQWLINSQKTNESASSNNSNNNVNFPNSVSLNDFNAKKEENKMSHKMKISKSMSNFHMDNSLIERLDVFSRSGNSISSKSKTKRTSRSPLQKFTSRYLLRSGIPDEFGDGYVSVSRSRSRDALKALEEDLLYRQLINMNEEVKVKESSSSIDKSRKTMTIKSISSNLLEPPVSGGTSGRKLNETRSPSKERSSSQEKLKNRPFVNPQDFEKFRTMVENVEAVRQRSRSNSQQKTGYISDASSTNVSPNRSYQLEKRPDHRNRKHFQMSSNAQYEISNDELNDELSRTFDVRKSNFHRFKNVGTYSRKPPLPISDKQKLHETQSDRSISSHLENTNNSFNAVSPIRSSSESMSHSKSRLKRPSNHLIPNSLQVPSQNKSKSHGNLGIDQIMQKKQYPSNSHQTRLKSHVFSDVEEDEMKQSNSDLHQYIDMMNSHNDSNDGDLKYLNYELKDRQKNHISSNHSSNYKEKSSIHNKRKLMEDRRKTITKRSGGIISGIRKPSNSPNSSRAASSNTIIRSKLPNSNQRNEMRPRMDNILSQNDTRNNSPSMSHVSSSTTTVNRKDEMESQCLTSNRLVRSIKKPSPNRKLSYTLNDDELIDMDNTHMSNGNVLDNNLLSTSIISQISDSSDTVARRVTLGHTAKGLPVIAPYEEADSGISSSNMTPSSRPIPQSASTLIKSNKFQIPKNNMSNSIMSANRNFQSRLKPISHINKPGFSSEGTHRSHLPTKPYYAKNTSNTFSKIRLNSKKLDNQY